MYSYNNEWCPLPPFIHLVGRLSLHLFVYFILRQRFVVELDSDNVLMLVDLWHAKNVNFLPTECNTDKVNIP